MPHEIKHGGKKYINRPMKERSNIEYAKDYKEHYPDLDPELVTKPFTTHDRNVMRSLEAKKRSEGLTKKEEETLLIHQEASRVKNGQYAEHWIGFKDDMLRNEANATHYNADAVLHGLGMTPPVRNKSRKQRSRIIAYSIAGGALIAGGAALALGTGAGAGAGGAGAGAAGAGAGGAGAGGAGVAATSPSTIAALTTPTLPGIAPAAAPAYGPVAGTAAAAPAGAVPLGAGAPTTVTTPTTSGTIASVTTPTLPPATAPLPAPTPPHIGATPPPPTPPAAGFDYQKANFYLNIANTGYSLYQQEEAKRKAKHAAQRQRKQDAWQNLMSVAGGQGVSPSTPIQAGPTVDLTRAISGLQGALNSMTQSERQSANDTLTRALVQQNTATSKARADAYMAQAKAKGGFDNAMTQLGALRLTPEQEAALLDQ
mgnify:CR=1 FL=1